MSIYETELGYVVRETTSGLDVYEDEDMENFVCKLSDMSLDNFRYDGDVDEDKLEAAIKEEVERLEILKAYYDYCL